jgi:hypothetical protein
MLSHSPQEVSCSVCIGAYENLKVMLLPGLLCKEAVTNNKIQFTSQ